MSDLADTLAWQVKAAGLPEPVRELRFSDRRFRFDLAWPEQRLAAEVDGGTWTGGRHSRGQGIHNDCVKVSLAASMGWRCMRFDREMVESGQALALVEEALSWQP